MRRLVHKAVANGIYHARLWRPYFFLKHQSKGAGAAILTFHRLVDDNSAYLYKGPTVQTHIALFEKLIATLVRYYEVAPLDGIVTHLDAGEPLPRDTLAVAFDDGYEDNYRLGLPVLARYGVSATVFVATGFIDTGERMWADRVEQSLLQTRLEALDLEDMGLHSSAGTTLALRTMQEKAQANALLCALLKELDSVELESAVGRLEHVLNADPAKYQRTMMTWNEVRELAAAGWDIGSHGVSHNIMTKLQFGAACSELESSKNRIEEKLQQSVRNFAYPNGRRKDFSEALTTECRRIGYESVSSCEWGLNIPRRDSAYFLKRVGLTRSLPQTLFALECLFRKERIRVAEENAQGVN